MAHVWRLEASAGWTTTPLAGSDSLTVADGKVHLEPRSIVAGLTAETAIVRHGTGRSEQWVLLAPPHSGVWVNGNRVPLGMKSLHDRDEIRLGDAEPIYFSTERLARVEPFPGGEKAVICPRCKQPIEPQAAAVCCAQCHAWYHESPELTCWTYAENCCCGHATALDAGYRWSPEEL